MIAKFKLFENNSYFKDLYDKYFNKMERWVKFKYFPDDSYDVCMDIFMNNIYPKLDKVKAAQNEEAYIRMIVRNKCIDKFRSLSKAREIPEENFKQQEVDDSDENWFSRVDSKKIQKAIQQLTPAYRKAIELFYLKDMTHDEIGKELGISPNTSKTNLMKAKAKLKEILEPERKLALQENLNIKKFKEFIKTNR